MAIPSKWEKREIEQNYNPVISEGGENGRLIADR